MFRNRRTYEGFSIGEEEILLLELLNNEVYKNKHSLFILFVGFSTSRSIEGSVRNAKRLDCANRSVVHGVA